jgi:hypothetical protein
MDEIKARYFIMYKNIAPPPRKKIEEASYRNSLKTNVKGSKNVI